MVTCPLAPGVPHLISGSCSSSRVFGLGFLQTPPRGDALALLLAFGSAKTWRGDLHPANGISCPAHTASASAAARSAVRCNGLLGSPVSETLQERIIEFLRCQPRQLFLQRHAFDLGRDFVSNRPHHSNRVELLLGLTHAVTPPGAPESRASDSPCASSRSCTRGSGVS